MRDARRRRIARLQHYLPEAQLAAQVLLRAPQDFQEVVERCVGQLLAELDGSIAVTPGEIVNEANLWFAVLLQACKMKSQKERHWPFCRNAYASPC